MTEKAIFCMTIARAFLAEAQLMSLAWTWVAHLPDARKAAHVDVPALLDALGADDVHALRVTADLGSIQCLPHHVHKLSFVDALHNPAHSVSILDCRSI